MKRCSVFLSYSIRTVSIGYKIPSSRSVLWNWNFRTPGNPLTPLLALAQLHTHRMGGSSTETALGNWGFLINADRREVQIRETISPVGSDEYTTFCHLECSHTYSHSRSRFLNSALPINVFVHPPWKIDSPLWAPSLSGLSLARHRYGLYSVLAPVVWELVVVVAAAAAEEEELDFSAEEEQIPDHTSPQAKHRQGPPPIPQAPLAEHISS